MKRLLLLACTVVSMGFASQAAQAPNILFIAIDDLRPELGCYGETAIISPNIDRLSATGVTFNRAYCQLAVCNPSRASIMTGLRPDTLKVWDLETDFRDTVPDVQTIPQTFRKYGYYAVSYGKIFHNPRPDNISWDEPHHWPKSSLWSDEAIARRRAYQERMRAEGRSEAAIARIRAQATEIVDKADNEIIDGAIAEQAIRAMRRLAKRPQPFFLAAGFIRPHLPFVVPRKYWELYREDAIPIATNPFLPRDAPPFAMNTMYELRDYWDFAGTPTPLEGSLSVEQQRRLKHGYYASVSYVDALVGRMLAELEDLGLAENTVVVLWGDHGWKLGEHNSWCKQSNYEIDARVPLIIRAPGAKGNGQASDALVEFVDVYPTLCDLAGLPRPDHLEGKSMAPLLSRPAGTIKPAAFNQFRRTHGGAPLMGYAMRTDRYRYVEWQNRITREVVATELYDQREDPQENTNIAGAYHDLTKKLSQQMWATLPQPPDYEPPRKKRPQAFFRNDLDVPLTLYWMKPDGGKRKQCIIEPGKLATQNTTKGHRFRVEGSNGFSAEFVIKKQRQTFRITPTRRTARPNFVFCMADDWSSPHAGVLGDKTVKTPNFDRVAREGVLFPNAFVSTPSCTPSRLSILTGQHHWRLKEGDSLGGSLREEYPVYTELLRDAGYRVGRYGKGVWPSKHTFRKRDSFGPQFRSLDEFLEERNPNQPFCFWFGGRDPHRPYDFGVGKRSGMDLERIDVPKCLPNHPEVRSDLADYYWHVQRFDRQVGEILEKLEAMGELENTMVVVSGDNGMPFPRCKATLYDLGTRVPLAVRWGARIPGERTVDDFVTLCDFAPTFLEAAGLKPAKAMTGQSLLPVLFAKQSGQIDTARTFVLTGLEQHCFPHPSRAMRTSDFLYILNFSPETWRAGTVEGRNPRYDFVETPWPTGPGAFCFNVDPSPSKQVLRLNPEAKPFAEAAFGRRPKEELYDLQKDPNQLHNVAGAPDYAKQLAHLRRALKSELMKSGDPRVIEGSLSP